jgi:hypothetical protein
MLNFMKLFVFENEAIFYPFNFFFVFIYEWHYQNSYKKHSVSKRTIKYDVLRIDLKVRNVERTIGRYT